MKKLKVLFIEDLRVVREGVNFLLSQYDQLDVIKDEVNLDHIPEFVAKHHIDVAIIDLQLALPPENTVTNGFEICSKIAKNSPRVKLIAHSMYDNVESVNKFFASGGQAFVSKKSGHHELISAINALAANKRFLCKETEKLSKNAERFLDGTDPQLKAVTEIFTKAEKSILEKIAKGFSTKQIAHQLEISEKTVETHRKHLFNKAGVKNVAELIAFVYSRRIVME